jgi:plastocyanin
MNKNYFIVGCLLAGIIILAAALSVTYKGTKKAKATTETAVAATSTEVVNHIALKDGKATPADLLIKVGEFVEFDSKDGKPHDIASGKGNDYGNHHDHTVGDGIESGAFAADEGYKVQFTKVGIYYFHDHLSPSIAISVAVYDPTQK